VSLLVSARRVVSGAAYFWHPCGVSLRVIYGVLRRILAIHTAVLAARDIWVRGAGALPVGTVRRSSGQAAQGPPERIWPRRAQLVLEMETGTSPKTRCAPKTVSLSTVTVVLLAVVDQLSVLWANKSGNAPSQPFCARFQQYELQFCPINRSGLAQPAQSVFIEHNLYQTATILPAVLEGAW